MIASPRGVLVGVAVSCQRRDISRAQCQLLRVVDLGHGPLHGAQRGSKSVWQWTSGSPGPLHRPTGGFSMTPRGKTSLCATLPGRHFCLVGSSAFWVNCAWGKEASACCPGAEGPVGPRGSVLGRSRPLSMVFPAHSSLCTDVIGGQTSTWLPHVWQAVFSTDFSESNTMMKKLFKNPLLFSLVVCC